jgi:hypothetical protein
MKHLLFALLLILAPGVAHAAFPVQAACQNAGTAGSPTGTHDATAPAGIAAGNLLTLQINFLNISDIDPVESGVTGFTFLGRVTNSDTSISSVTAMYAKIASGSESNFTYSSTPDTYSQTRWCRWTGAHASAMPEIISNEFTADYANPPSLTPSWGALDTTWCSLGSKYNGSDIVTAYPSNYTLYQFSNTTGQFDAQVFQSCRELNATDENPGGYTFDGAGNGVAVTIAIRPAAAAATRRRAAPIIFQ